MSISEQDIFDCAVDGSFDDGYESAKEDFQEQISRLVDENAVLQGTIDDLREEVKALEKKLSLIRDLI